MLRAHRLGGECTRGSDAEGIRDDEGQVEAQAGLAKFPDPRLIPRSQDLARSRGRPRQLQVDDAQRNLFDLQVPDHEREHEPDDNQRSDHDRPARRLRNRIPITAAGVHGEACD